MQLNHSNIGGISSDSVSRKTDDSRSIGLALAAATCALLGVQSAAVEAKGKPDTWDVDTAVLFYQESDSRVQAIEPVVSATRNFENEQYLNIKLAVDTLTGASPYGATPSDEVQTFTSPSGNMSYQIQPNQTPLDDTFHDLRGALSTTWGAPIDRDWAYTLGAYGSTEYDYLSLGLNGTISRYLNNKNTTLTAGLSVAMDSVTPEGGIPIGLVRMPAFGVPTFDADFDASRKTDSDTKNTIDLLLGVTQVINRQTIMQFNYSLSMVDGYLTDPFKILSVIDDRTGANYGGNYKDGDGNSIYLYESRPDSRLKHALYWQTKYMLGNGDVIDGSYRFMLDDWGISSHTFDLRYRWSLGSSYLEPHVRYYMQSEADFYKRYLTAGDYNNGAPVLQNASADYRLGELTNYTLGLKYGYRLSADREFAVRLEYYKQTNTGETGFGKLARQELYPDTDAVWLQFSYNF